MIKVLESELGRFNLHVAEDHLRTLATYCTELMRWNQKMNLTGLAGAEMVRRLVAEPFWIAQQLKMSGVLVDIGSGNGSPAIPLHVVSDLHKTNLVESRSKRAAFLRHLVSVLQLSNVTVHRSRFEEVEPQAIGPADWISLQAVSLTPQLFESIKLIAHKTTTVVWITSTSVRPVLPPSETLEVPITGSVVFLFRLDLT